MLLQQHARAGGGSTPCAMQKVVLNYEYRHFSLAPGLRFACDHAVCRSQPWPTCRMHPDLIAMFEGDTYAYAEVVAIPAGLDFQIHECDDTETLVNFAPKRGLDAETTARLLEWIRNECGYE